MMISQEQREGVMSEEGFQRSEFERNMGYNPAFLRRAREKQRLARVEAHNRARMERLKAEREEAEARRLQLAEWQAEQAQIQKNRQAVALYRVIDCIKGKPNPSIKEIITLVAAEHGFSYADLLGQCRQRKIIRARHEAMWRVRQMRPELALTQIGRAFGKDHTTVINALQRHEERMSATHISRKAA